MKNPVIKTLISNFNLDYFKYLLKYIIAKQNLLLMEKGSYGNPKIVWYGGNNKVLIGKFCSIAKNVTFVLGPSHNTNLISTYPFSLFYPHKLKNNKLSSHVVEKGDINVGNDVWIGYGATILSGVNIHDGSVIAAGSLVTKDVPAYTIVGGNPARFIKKRFKNYEIDSLLKIKWWDWDSAKLKRNMYYLSSNNLKSFFNNIKD